MKTKTHFGVGGNTSCGEHFAVATTTTPNAVTCEDCLWLLVAQMVDQLNIALNRLREVTKRDIKPISTGSLT